MVKIAKKIDLEGLQEKNWNRRLAEKKNWSSKNLHHASPQMISGRPLIAVDIKLFSDMQDIFIRKTWWAALNMVFIARWSLTKVREYTNLGTSCPNAYNKTVVFFYCSCKYAFWLQLDLNAYTMQRVRI